MWSQGHFSFVFSTGSPVARQDDKLPMDCVQHLASSNVDSDAAEQQ